MPITLSIEELLPRFPDFRVAAIVVDGISATIERSPTLDALIAEREEACRARWNRLELSEIPGIAVWREAYKRFGIKKTSYRSSVERLLKRVKAGERLPAVNTLVDLYNVVSLSHVFCCGADDLDKVEAPLAFRFSRDGDTFIDMAAQEGGEPNDPPKEGEVVYADLRHILCRRWNWRQDARTGIDLGTRRAIVTIQGNGWGDVDAAVAEFADLVRDHCSATPYAEIADAGRPVVSVGSP